MTRSNRTSDALKDELHKSLREARSSVLSKVEGLSEFDMRRPMTPTGTNLLGLVKHLGMEEYGYLGGVFGRPPPERMKCDEDGSVWQGGDMWALPDESSAYILGFYQRACAHADHTITSLALDAPGSVPWWGEGQRATNLGVILVRMVGETQRHAGHIDVVRELVDGFAGTDNAELGDEKWWRAYVVPIQAAADSFT
jgi:hypothetical protein